jgi:hypothetical protein
MCVGGRIKTWHDRQYFNRSLDEYIRTRMGKCKDTRMNSRGYDIVDVGSHTDNRAHQHACMHADTLQRY